MKPRRLEGKVALILGGGTELGREVALVLASHGARVVVAGEDERALGETVGEIAHGGGKARHVVGGMREGAARAGEAFGALDLVVDAAPLPRSPP